jgi:hypothetical protein
MLQQTNGGEQSARHPKPALPKARGEYVPKNIRQPAASQLFGCCLRDKPRAQQVVLPKQLQHRSGEVQLGKDLGEVGIETVCVV